MQTRNKAIRCIGLLLAAMMLLTACGGGENDDTQPGAGEEKAAEGVVNGSGATAVSMHLVRMEGEVYVSDDAGKSLEPRENMGLYSGYELSTEVVSYSWLNLDDVKLAKMDQSSKIAVRKEGKNLEVKVYEGSLFFNVTEPLADDETMNITTSTMMVGIRGTCGWVENQDDVSRVYLLEGKVECSAGEHIFTINAGDMIEITSDGDIDTHPFTGEDIPDYVREELDEELAAAFPVSEFSRFRNQWGYVDEDTLPSETKEFLRHIMDAVQSEYWDDAQLLALSMVDAVNIAGEDVVWEYNGRHFYSEFDGYRIEVYNFDYRDEEAKGDRIATSTRIEIRPESGRGYYIHCASMIDAYEQPYTMAGFAVGQCENYNWTGSFERNAYDTGDPVLSSDYWEEDWHSWSD